jgi:glucose-6-phosphate isomerase
VGGRFSIFTPVGLFVAALTGLNIEKFLEGAAFVRSECEQNPSHPIAVCAQSLLKLEKSHSIHVMMPYAQSLKLVANWWVQLWAESLGKDGRGFMAVPALGAIDQHSLLQLLRDGPNDKIIWFISVQSLDQTVTIPSVNFSNGTFGLIEGKTLNHLLTTECQAIIKVMKNQNRPNLTLDLGAIDEFHLGGLFFLLSTLTAHMGDCMNINPFDQPGVEEGKIYIRDVLLQK